MASLVDIVEGHHVARRQRRPQRVGATPVRLEDAAHADVARDDGIGNARQAAVIEVDVGAAHLAGHRLQ